MKRILLAILMGVALVAGVSLHTGKAYATNFCGETGGTPTITSDTITYSPTTNCDNWTGSHWTVETDVFYFNGTDWVVPQHLSGGVEKSVYDIMPGSSCNGNTSVYSVGVHHALNISWADGVGCGSDTSVNDDYSSAPNEKYMGGTIGSFCNYSWHILYTFYSGSGGTLYQVTSNQAGC